VSRSGRILLSRWPIIASLWIPSALIALRPALTHPPCPDEVPQLLSSSTAIVGPADLMSVGFDPRGVCESLAGRIVRPDGTLNLRWYVPESSHERIAPEIRAGLDLLRLAASGKV
jgi:hypothetical protein